MIKWKSIEVRNRMITPEEMKNMVASGQVFDNVVLLRGGLLCQIWNLGVDTMPYSKPELYFDWLIYDDSTGSTIVARQVAHDGDMFIFLA